MYVKLEDLYSAMEGETARAHAAAYAAEKRNARLCEAIAIVGLAIAERLEAIAASIDVHE